MLQDLALGLDTVDVSMETLASLWARDPRDPCDLSDFGEKLQEPTSVWGGQCVFGSCPPAGLTWTEQLSPHLQRNKQLQDTLLQREEELARLQDENNKLREFLSSSFVRKLEQKAKKLTVDWRRKLKRNLTDVDDGSLQHCTQQVTKRVCRNLTAEFCSDSSETSSSSEPNLDLWVLRTLGLKDRDTIDTSSDDSSSSGYSLCSLVYDAAVTSSSPSDFTLSSSFSPSVATSTPSSAHSFCQRSTPETGYCGDPAKPPPNCSDLTAAGLTRQYEAPEAVIRSFNTLPAFQSPLTDGAEVGTPITDPSPVQTPERNPAKQLTYWCPLRGSGTPSQDTVQLSPPGEGVYFSSSSSLSPARHQSWTPVRGDSTSPLAGPQPPAAPRSPRTPRSRTDLAFSMSLSPSSSVKTHSFPQGQAFVRKDTEGKWNFTWVPRQGP